MSLATLSGKALAALAGATLLASAFAAPASAMPLPVAGAGIEVGAPLQQVWYDRMGYWHPNHRWHRAHCWRGRWGRLHCG